LSFIEPAGIGVIIGFLGEENIVLVDEFIRENGGVGFEALLMGDGFEGGKRCYYIRVSSFDIPEVVKVAV
jgi:hypothetical protein